MVVKAAVHDLALILKILRAFLKLVRSVDEELDMHLHILGELVDLVLDVAWDLAPQVLSTLWELVDVVAEIAGELDECVLALGKDGQLLDVPAGLDVDTGGLAIRTVVDLDLDGDLELLNIFLDVVRAAWLLVDHVGNFLDLKVERSIQLTALSEARWEFGHLGLERGRQLSRASVDILMELLELLAALIGLVKLVANEA